MKKYNHAYTVAFSVNSDHPEGRDLTDLDLFTALTKRGIDLTEAGEWQEALGAPYDTYENQETEATQ